MNPKQILLSALGIVILAGGLIVAMKLVQSNQNNRTKASADLVDISLSPDKTNVLPGDTINVAVGMNPHAYKIAAIDLSIDYGPQFDLVSFTPTTHLPQTLQTLKTATGNVQIILGSNPSTQQDQPGVIANMVLQAKTTASGQENISVNTATEVSGVDTNGLATTANILGDADNIALTVEPLPSPTPTTAPTPNSTPVTTEPKTCGGICNVHSDCQAGLFCYAGNCRNPECAIESSCTCLLPTPTPTRPLTVVYPNGGETWTFNQGYNITWQSNPEIIKKVRIAYISADDVNATQYIIADNMPNINSYHWWVNVSSNIPRIKIVVSALSDNAVVTPNFSERIYTMDESDGPITIIFPPSPTPPTPSAPPSNCYYDPAQTGSILICPTPKPTTKPVPTTTPTSELPIPLPRDYSCVLSGGFKFATNLKFDQPSLNWGGLNEKWFLENNSQWYYIMPVPGSDNPYAGVSEYPYQIMKWNRGLAAGSADISKDTFVAGATRTCYDNPGLIYQPIIKACPQDLKLCPGGGSAVRVGPNCEFEACPIISSPLPTSIPKSISLYSCFWCGNECTRNLPNMDCNNALPMPGQVCYENAGECVIKQSDTAVSIKARTVGNFNGDSKIDIFDYNIFIAGFVRKEPTIDITGDGKIDIFDYNILVSNFGK